MIERVHDSEWNALKEENVKGLLDVIYLISCKCCERVKWCNKWMHFNEVDKEGLRRREVYWKYVTCKEYEVSHSAIADS